MKPLQAWVGVFAAYVCGAWIWIYEAGGNGAFLGFGVAAGLLSVGAFIDGHGRKDES